MSDDKQSINMVERSTNVAGNQTDWQRYGSDPDTVQAYKTILGWSAEERAAQERRLVRKLDLMILLPVLVMYVTNYLDRNSIAQARVSGLTTATNITANQYSLVNGIFYISYVIAQTPSQMLFAKARPSIFLPAVMILWAIISACTATTKSLGQLIAVRFILGFAEAPFFPCAAFYLTCWYTKAEIGRRYALYVGGICLSSAIAGLISAGIIDGLSGAHGISGWQWLFIIEGAATVGIAIIVAFIIPDFPHTAKQLSPLNRVLAQLRLDDDLGSYGSQDVSAKKGLIMAVKDYRTWCMGSLQLCITNMIGFNFFYPTLIEGLGYSNKITILLLTAPPYVFAFLVAFVMGWNADRVQKRALHWQIAFAVTAVGLILLIALATVDSPGGRYACTYILAAGSFSAYSIAYPWVAALIPRPLTKRAVVIAIANSMSNIGAFASPYVFYAVFGPSYRTSWGIVLAMVGYSSACVYFLAWKNGKRNDWLTDVEEKYKNGDVTDAELDGMDPDAQFAARSGFRLVT